MIIASIKNNLVPHFTGPLFPKAKTMVILGLALAAIAALPIALADNAYQRCLSICKCQYPDGPELIACFQRCRIYYGPGQ